MIGLFKYEYDHFEWEFLIVVSDKEKKLIDYFTDGVDTSNGEVIRALTEQAHIDLSIQEKEHYFIKPIEFI